MFIWILPLFLIVVGLRALRQFRDSGREGGGYREEFPPLDKKKLSRAKKEAGIFKLADRMKGRITLSDIVLETGMGLEEGETFIKSMIDGIHVSMEVTENGTVVYEFPEIISRHENNS